MRAVLQVRERFLHEHDRTAQIHVERLGQRVHRDLPERLRQRIGGIVDQHIDTTELGDGALDQRGQIVDLTEMGRHADRRATHPAQVRRSLFACVRLAAGHDDLRSS